MINIKTNNFIKNSSKAIEEYYNRAKQSWDNILISFKNSAKDFALKAKSLNKPVEEKKLNTYYEKTKVTNAAFLIGGMNYKGWRCIIDQAKENNRTDILLEIEEFLKNFKDNAEKISAQIYNSNKEINITEFMSPWRNESSNNMCGENGMGQKLKEMIVDLGTDSGTGNNSI